MTAGRPAPGSRKGASARPPRAGQAASEYVAAASILLVAALALLGLARAVRGHGERAVEITASEYP